MTNHGQPENDTSNDKVIEFLIEDYKLKVNYLNNHFSRILTRFNFFLTIQIALFGVLGFFLFGEGRNVDATLIPIILGLATSVIWLAIGCQDRRLVVIYRGGMRLAAKKIFQAFKSKDLNLHGWTDKYFVGSYEGVLSKDDKSFIDKFLIRFRKLISITRVPASISAILIIFWSGIWVMQYNNCFIFDSKWEKSCTDKFKVTRVPDGDTIKVESQGNTTNIRLVGIDAPETFRKKREAGQPFIQKSTKHLASLVLNKIVDVKGYGTDRYGRTLGAVYVDGKNVNIEMVKQGLSEVYRGKPAKGFDTEPYWKAEEEAKKAGVGIWSLGEKYISPREWRRIKRNK